MKRITKFIIFLIAIAVLVTVTLKFNSGNTIKVGIINPLSGPVMQRGEEITNTIELSKPKHIELVYGDDKCDGSVASTTYNDLKNKGIKIFYVSCSTSLLSIAPQAKIDGNLLITSYAGAIEIRNTGDEVIRFIPDALSAVDVIYSDINKLSTSTKYALLYEDQDYSQFIVSNIKNRVGTSTKVSSEVIPPASTSTEKQIAKLKSDKIDTVFFIPTSDHSCKSPITIKNSGLDIVCYEVGFDKDTDSYNKLVKNYEDKYKMNADNPFYNAITYDVFKLLGKFASKSHSDDYIPELKKYILSGVEGEMSKYTFTKDGEVEAKNLLKRVVVDSK